jgi:gluconolactonase
MNLLTVSVFVLLSIGLIGQPSQQIFDRAYPPELVFDNGQGFILEGPTVSKEGEVFFSDVPGSDKQTGVIWKYNPETKVTAVYRSPSGRAIGLAFDKKGRLIACESKAKRLTRTDMKSGLSEIVAGSFEQKFFNSTNDVVIDERGNIYFSDPKFSGSEPMYQPVHGIYKMDTLGKVTLLIAYIRKPNGLTIAPDQKTLYVATCDNVRNGNVTSNYKGDGPKFSGKLLAFNLSEDGTAKFREELADFGTSLGSLGDGMTVDSEGNIYVTLPYSYKLLVYTPEGKKVDEIEMPNGPVTNVTFGRGVYHSTLFVTAGKHLYTIKTYKKGYSLPFDR